MPTIQSRVLLVGLILIPTLALAAESPSGEAIYRQQCLSCHGKAGEGSKDYPKALEGDRSVGQLARLIGKTMPEDDPGSCVGEDANKVAAYIHATFYSPIARERSRPPRIELSRLTVRQYLNATADLIGSFRGNGGEWGESRGLHGEYFKSRNYRNSERVIDRTDPEIRFDFRLNSPEPGKMDAEQFSIRWNGSVLAPETGEYEFIVNTEHALRLWVNDLNRPLIDGTVQSGKDTEHKESITLLGGRAYPIRLEFSKAKQGVDDSKKNKPKPVQTSISLSWKRPHRPAEIIAARFLSPNTFPETMVVTTHLPPDDRSAGYERGTSVSKAWDQGTTDAAIEIANYVATPARLRELAGVGDSIKGEERTAKLREFCRTFVERAFRRPLSDDQKAFFVDRQFAESSDPETAVKRVVLLALKSPRFLYHATGTGPYDVASRLSFALWDSLPDKPLRDAAASGTLTHRTQVSAQAQRMVSDLRTRAKVRDFLLQWLRVDQNPDISKDPEKYPGFDESVASDLRSSLEIFLDDVVWGDRSDFRQLLLADSLYLNGRLAKIYGVDLPADAPFQKVLLEPGERAGVLSHPYLLSAFAYTASGSPIHRGVFLSRSVLGRGLKTPPVAVAPLAADLHADLTTRERVTLQTKPASCMTCHGMINPLGYSLEHFDAVGRYRRTEKGRAIDASGIYEPPSGEPVRYNGVRELATRLVSGEETPSAFVNQLFHAMIKQPIRAHGPQTLADLSQSFVDGGFEIRSLLVEIAKTAALSAKERKP